MKNNDVKTLAKGSDKAVDMVLKLLKEKLSKYNVRISRAVANNLIVDVSRRHLRDVAKIVHNELGAYVRTCVGCDERNKNGCFAVYYIFGLDDYGVNVIVRTLAPANDVKVPSIADIAPGADWCELEFRDLLGIDVTGRPVYRLILPEDWPDDLHPLRKDVPYGVRPPPVKREGVTLTELESPGIPVGPYHPALHEPEYFELYVEGETIIDVRYRGFHIHRGIEKLGESKLTYKQIPFIAERICGICGFCHSTCYVMAVEKAAKIEVPERAEFIRAMVLEIERIHSHLLWLGVACHLLGYDAGFMHTWRIREAIMKLAEYLTGSRKTYGINIIGGVRKDINKEKIQNVLRTLNYIEREVKELIDVMLSVPEVKRRLTGTGILTKGEARKLSVVGPVARASGLNRDVRKDYPYLAYKYVSFKVPVYTEGDNLSRTLVRVEEIFESISIIRQLLDRLPGGDIKVEKYEIESDKVSTAAVEAPRGEDIHFLITGKGRPYRWKVRAPTYQNIPALRPMLREQLLADAPITIASIDPCFSCTDRVIIIEIRNGKIVNAKRINIVRLSRKR